MRCGAVRRDCGRAGMQSRSEASGCEEVCVVAECGSTVAAESRGGPSVIWR